MNKLIAVLTVLAIAALVVALAVQVGYCAFLGDPTSPRYYAICVADD